MYTKFARSTVQMESIMGEMFGKLRTKDSKVSSIVFSRPKQFPHRSMIKNSLDPILIPNDVMKKHEDRLQNKSNQLTGRLKSVPFNRKATALMLRCS